MRLILFVCADTTFINCSYISLRTTCKRYLYGFRNAQHLGFCISLSAYNLLYTNKTQMWISFQPLKIWVVMNGIWWDLCCSLDSISRNVLVYSIFFYVAHYIITRDSSKIRLTWLCKICVFKKFCWTDIDERY